jgi:hypothetical protein
MNLLTQKQLAVLAGVSSAAITKARKKKRVEHFNGTKNYDIDSPLNKAFLNDLNPNRINSETEIVLPGTPEQNETLLNQQQKSLDAVAKLAKEKAELTKQNRIKVQLQNAVRRGELIEAEAVEQSLMMFLDRWLNVNKRKFNSYWQELIRNIQSESKPIPELKREFLNMLEGAADEAKLSTCEKLEEIKIDQGKGK